MLILEILTLLVCIVTFAPLSNAASNAFIFTIALTALLLLLIPLILTFISGFKGDKAEHEIKRDKERQAAVVRQPGPRKPIPFAANSICVLAKLLVLAICPGSFLLSFLVLYFTKNHQDQLAVLLLRQLFMALAGTAFLSVIPLFAVLGGTAQGHLWFSVCISRKPALLYRLQRQYGSAGGICFVLLRLEGYSLGRRSIRIRGTFTGRQRMPTVRIRKAPFPRRSGFPAPFR